MAANEKYKVIDQLNDQCPELDPNASVRQVLDAYAQGLVHARLQSRAMQAISLFQGLKEANKVEPRTIRMTADYYTAITQDALAFVQSAYCSEDHPGQSCPTESAMATLAQAQYQLQATPDQSFEDFCQ